MYIIVYMYSLLNSCVCARRKYKYSVDKQYAENMPLQTIKDFIDCMSSLGKSLALQRVKFLSQQLFSRRSFYCTSKVFSEAIITVVYNRVRIFNKFCVSCNSCI